MSATEKLQTAQSLLTENSVRDVKFFFKPEARSAMLTTLQNDVADVLGKYFDGKKTTLQNFSDEVLPA